MKADHHGSCHCGAVRFSCSFDLSAGTSRCNCSVCTKSRFWKAIVPAADFTLEAGEDALAEYRFGSGSVAHRFCRSCGVKPFGQGHLDGIGDFYAVNVACLDDVSPQALAGAPVTFEDGRHDRWDRVPEETRYL